LVNITEDYGTDMTRDEIETIVADELEFLLRWESNLPEPSQDMELIKAVMRVLEEFKVNK
jgi:hypothetical protein